MNTNSNSMQETGLKSIDSFFKYGETLDQLERPSFTPQIHKVVEMFTSEYTENLHDRKANSILKFCKQRPKGFFYQQIQGLTQVLQLARADLFNGVIEMAPVIESLLKINSANQLSMFNKNYNSDELKYMGFIPAFLDSLEPFLHYQKHMNAFQEMDLLRQTVIDYLRRFAERQIHEIMTNEESFDNQKSESIQKSPMQVLISEGTKHLRAFCQSKILNSLVELLYNYQNHPYLVHPLLELFSYMMMYSRLADELCQQGLLKLLLEIVSFCDDFRSHIVKIVFEIFWSAIEAVQVQILIVLATQPYVSSLHRLFLKVLKEGYKLEDKYLRNQILILVNYLLSLPQAIKFFLEKPRQNGHQQPSFLEDLFFYSIIDEVKFSNSKSTNRKAEFGTNAEDLQLKKLLWSGVLAAIQSNNQQVIQIGKRQNFIKFLLMYIDTANNSHSIARWSPPQLRQLQQHALTVIASVILHMKDDFEEKKGIFYLTKFLSNANDVDRRQKCLKAFSNASLFEEQYKIKISEEGIIDYLIEFLQSDDNPTQIKELCFTILANLCQNCRKNKKLFREKNGVEIVIGFLKDPTIATSNRYVLLGLSMLNCMWNSILGSRRSEQKFLSLQGLFDLLEFIQKCDYSHRKMALSCLSFLTENSKVIEEFLEWNSQNTMVNATQLMIKLYTEEDERYGVKYEQGVVMNRRRPLVPAQKTRATTDYFLKDLTDTGTETYLVNRIREQVQTYDMRLIVFSILYRVGFNKNDLNAYEQQKIEVIQRYPHFKMGEIWGEIKDQLQNDQIEPTVEDRHWMETAIEQFEEEMSNCVNTQSLIIREFQKTQESQLNKFYQVIKYNKQLA